jgi:hypothetical protein
MFRCNKKSNETFPIVITGVAAFSIGKIWPLMSDSPAPTGFLPYQNPIEIVHSL